MRPFACFTAAGMLAVAAFSANAATTAYGEAFDTLYTIDLSSRVATPVGSAGRFAGVRIGNISGLTTVSDGTQYAVSGALKLFLRIEPDTGGSTVVSALNFAGQGTGQFDALDLGMTADCDDNLWLSSGTLQQIWKVDPKTGASALVGTTGHPISGLVARDDELYGTGSRSDHTFYRIDKSTGTATAIGDFGPAAPAWLNSVSMGFDSDGTLLAVLNYVPPAAGTVTPDWSDLASIDPSTGQVSIRGPITGPDTLRQIGMKGFTTGPPQCRAIVASPNAVPVGSPWTLTLLGALLVLAGLYGAGRGERKL